MGDASCPPNKDDYYGKGALSIFIQSIPFIGGAIDGYVPGPKNNQNTLDTLHSNLTAQVNDWQKEITDLVKGDVQDLNNLITTILGNPDNGVPGYADVVSQYYLEPVKEQGVINNINLIFLGIIISFILMYLLANKKSS